MRSSRSSRDHSRGTANSMMASQDLRPSAQSMNSLAPAQMLFNRFAVEPWDAGYVAEKSHHDLPPAPVRSTYRKINAKAKRQQSKNGSKAVRRASQKNITMKLKASPELPQ